MAKTRFFQNTFTSGVLSPLLKGRTDIQQYYNAVEKADNWIVIPQGGIKRRPGTRFIDDGVKRLTRNTTVPTMPNGGTAANINDDDDSTTATTTTNISTISPYVVAQYDLGSATLVKFVDVRGIFLTSQVDSGFRIDYSDDAVSWTNAVAFPTDVGTSAQNFRFDVESAGAHRYWRLQITHVTDLGTDKVTLSEFNIIEELTAVSEIQLESFSVATDEHYLMAFSDQNCAIYQKKEQSDPDINPSLIANVKMPYSTTEVSEIRVVQTENVMLVFHEDYPTKRIISLSPTVWLEDDFPYSNIPQFDFNDSLSPTPVDEVQVMTFTAFVAGDTFQVDIEGVLSKNITFAGDATADERSATVENIRKNLQDMPVFGETGVAVARTGALQYTITISGESTKDFELFSAFPTTGTASKSIAFTKSASGSPRKEDLWSATRGYPKMGTFHDGRLVLGGTKSKTQSLIISRPGLFNDFLIDEGDDDEGIFITLASRKLVNIIDVFSGRNLQIFTDGAEFAVFDSPITPSTITVKNQTSYGSLNIPATEIDGAVLFADRNGKSIKTTLYDFNEDAYIAKDISVLSPELISTPRDIAILGGTASDDANWVFIVNNDGSATILNTLREQDINAFTKWTTSGELISCAVVDDQLYMVNKRNINGTDVYHIEQWSFNKRTDNGVTQAVAGATVSNLDHLEGETVSLVADGSVLPDRTVSSGTVTLTADEQLHTNVEVGIKYTCTLKPMPINTNVGSGQNQMRIKKVVRTNIRVKNTFGVYIEGNPYPNRKFGDSSSSPLGTPPQEFSGILDDVYITQGFDRYDSMPEITLPDPTPCEILAIEYEVESS